MNKENNRSAAGLRRSAIAERIRLREEWSELKGTAGESLTALNRQKQMIKQPVKSGCSKLKPNYVQSGKIYNTRLCQNAQVNEVLAGVVALVEVGAECRALPLRAALTALGATVVPAWTPIVTHVIWSQGGCRSTRARARALASLVVSPLWVEACAAAQARLPERTFPAAARASDLPSPRTLRRLLKKAEMENIPLLDLLPDKDKEGEDKATRLRLSSETENDTSATTNDTSQDESGDKSRDKTTDTSHDKSGDTSHDKSEIESRVNTAPRRALPISMSPPKPTKSRRKLFTHKEADVSKDKGSGDESDQSENGTKPVIRVMRPSIREKRDLARAERMAKRLMRACTPAPATATARTIQPRIVLTGMNKTERRATLEAIRKLNGHIQCRVTKNTTHVILGNCKHDDNTQHNHFNMGNVRPFNDTDAYAVQRSDATKPRTLNALLGAARGARILNPLWAIESARQNQWVHHHGYEIPHLKKISEKARIERTALGKLHSEYAYDVFYGMRVRISPNAEQKDSVVQLLKLCGAVIQDGDTQQNGEHDLTIGIDDGKVSSKWVFDSVAAARMRTTRRYINNALSNTYITQTTAR
ncbi:unnamed protein product [Diatraea saccharalis]|uniref:BRCT domain-containing protein n=1 Tax=Diatraea saccharalis TaxID=40085 RepID=A0A9N9RBE4_9NEOP|nr:unnamed protein product [Diatraea saccharalis]